MDPEEIKQMIESGLPDSQVDVRGDGRHFDAVVTSPAFAGKSLIEQHRMVYAVLGDSLKTRLHALSIRTQVPK